MDKVIGNTVGLIDSSMPSVMILGAANISFLGLSVCHSVIEDPDPRIHLSLLYILSQDHGATTTPTPQHTHHTDSNSAVVHVTHSELFGEIIHLDLSNKTL